jgi:HemY protein
MRAALWFLALFAIAVAIALFAGNNQGTITVYWPPYRIDLSLNMVVLGLAATFLLLHLALIALSALFALPGQARRWRMQHQERAMHVALLDALSHLLAGRFIRARKAAQLALARESAVASAGEVLPYAGRWRAISHLLAAQSAQALQDRDAREAEFQAALSAASQGDAQETREGLQLRAARWALDDHDARGALQWLDELPQGTARRTIALRLRLEAARLAGETGLALDTARLLAKHRAFSDVAALGVVRGLALQSLHEAHDPEQLQAAWDRLDPAECAMPEVAIAAAQRMLDLKGDAALARQWLMGLWEGMASRNTDIAPAHRSGVIRVLEQSFAQASGAPDAQWLTRTEQAQMANPADPGLQYLAGMTCMRLKLWGKAQQLLRLAAGRLDDPLLARRAWRALAQLAEQRDDPQGALQAWQAAARE